MTDDTRYRIAVNVLSQASPSELLFLVDDDLRHPVTARLPELAPGFTALPSQPGALALDFIRCFFQAEDGIRDIGVTGVQTCALPIWPTGRTWPTRAPWSPPAVGAVWSWRPARTPRSAGCTGWWGRPRRCRRR